MSRGGRNGRPSDEMYSNRGNDGGDSPTIEPLRINKRGSTASPVPSNSSLKNPSAPQTTYPIPSLPYPDGPHKTQQQNPYQYSYPDPRRVGSPTYAQSAAPRASSASSNRQNVSDTPASLRPKERRESRTGQNQTLAERRGTAPKPLPDSPGPDIPDKDEFFQKAPLREHTAGSSQAPQAPDVNPFPDYHQQYWPPPGSASLNGGLLNPGNAEGLQRISSTASNATTKATRGSPPPPETPINGPTGRPQTDIEARYAAAGIAGQSTLTNLQAQSMAAQQRAANYQGFQPRTQGNTGDAPPRRPWTPTEQPGEGRQPSTVFQGDSEVDSPPPQSAAAVPNARPNGTSTPPQARFQQPPQQRTQSIPQNLAEDINRLQVTDEPPPAYSAGPSGPAAGQYPNEKGRLNTNVGQGASTQASTVQQMPSNQTPAQQQHPAYANDARSAATNPQRQPSQNGTIRQSQVNYSQPQSSIPNNPPASPPPLPEGWIAHMDPNSSQYYYIHLPTQSTQWEFPKGPTPLNLNEQPLSPAVSNFNNPLASPGFSMFSKPMASPGMPMTPGFDQQHMSIGGAMQSQAFTGPPPSAGVDLYKVGATNGVYFGPYLRYINIDMERGLWLGSIMLVTDGPQPPTIHLHQSVDLSPNPRQLKGLNIATHQRWTFYKYEIDIPMMDEGSAKWTYAITSHLGCTRYEFLVAGRHETNWRFVCTSGNDFSLNVNANERARLGGVGYMWKDIMQKHAECGGFHTQLGLGGQIFADRLWKEIPALKQWLAMSGKENRKNAVWTAAHEEDVSHAYFHYYTSHFDQPHLREAFAQIPHICTIDDHDIFDGFGSYPEYMQFSNMFKNIGRIGIETYLLFQHHTTLEILRTVSNDTDLFTITGTGWHFVKYLGPAVAVVGPDCRSERTQTQVMAGPTYQGLFPKIAMLPSSVQHCLIMIGVPILYPRLEAAEQLANTVATGKKAVTGAYNMVGKVSSSIAGVVGAKGAVGSGFDSVKRAVGKSGLMGGILSPFGEVGVLDELKDQWTHESKDLERTYLIRTLQGIAHNRSIRMTFLSGAVSMCGAGLLHDPSKPSDHKTMYQLISSAVVNTPPNSYVLKLLNNSKPLYVPINGHRSTPSAPTDTKEDMMEIFTVDVDGRPRGDGRSGGGIERKLMARRNYVAIVAYDPEVVTGTFGRTDMKQGSGRLSLAADFMVQGDGAQVPVVKYGPVVVPSLEYGR